MLGVVAAEFPEEMNKVFVSSFILKYLDMELNIAANFKKPSLFFFLRLQMELSRTTALCLLELLISPSTDLLPLVSPLRRAAIDLIGRGFAVYQPHLDISKVLLGLLDLAASNEKYPS